MPGSSVQRFRRRVALTAGALFVLLPACEVLPRSEKQDTSVAAARAMPRDSIRRDTPAGVPPTPSESAAVTPTVPDSLLLHVYPTTPRRGGVIFAFLEGTVMTTPRCTWKNEPLPCYSLGGGIVATVPLPADEPVGTFSLGIDRPTGRVAREITVAERDFGGSDLIFLDSAKYALLRSGREIARDARALRGVLSAQSSERHWSGRWKEALPGVKSSGYGEERFYYPVADSTRTIRIASNRRARGSFAADTSTLRPGDAPGWRHAGVDIAAKRGTPILAPASGIVTDVGDYVLTGNTLVLDHGQGVHSAYFHLDSVLVRKGDLVRTGRTIARVGATGLATGPHLHYGIYVHGKDVDPAAWRDMPQYVLSDSAARVAFRPGVRTPNR